MSRKIKGVGHQTDALCKDGVRMTRIFRRKEAKNEEFLEREDGLVAILERRRQGEQQAGVSLPFFYFFFGVGKPR
jgi:hypothetical protein